MAEHPAFNREAAGSIPDGPTKGYAVKGEDMRTVTNWATGLLVAFLAFAGMAWVIATDVPTADATAGPGVFRVALAQNLPVPNNTVVEVPLGRVIDETNAPVQLVNGRLEFVRDCWCVVEAHMDWPTASETGMRRMDIRRLVTGSQFMPRMGSAQVGPDSGDGYGHASSAPWRFTAGDVVYVEVKQKSGADTVLQNTWMTWVVVWEVP